MPHPALAAPHVYNLFPRLAGDMSAWGAHAARARGMGFDWLYLNPVHYPGYSGSCYAVKDYWRVDPVLLPEGHADKHYEDGVRGDGGLEALGDALFRIRQLGLRPVMDLVINHTAHDSPLVREHPEWYVRDAAGNVQSPSAIDPADARRVTVWGDLAEIDNHASPDRDGLWDHWTRIVECYARLGFQGFRCDAAYKVPAALWRRLAAAARRVEPEAVFFAETLGARLEEIEALWDAGLDFVFNSSKWWDFAEPWCLEQQSAQPPHIRSLSFPETHDTPRLWDETGGSAAVQRQRYVFAAGFATGVLLPAGYEYGFRRRIDVVHTRPDAWEAPRADLTAFVTRVNALRREIPALHGERVEALSGLDGAVLVLEKRTDAAPPGAAGRRALVVVNKDRHAPQTAALPAEWRRTRVLRPCRDDAPPDESAAARLELAPAEVVYLV